MPIPTTPKNLPSVKRYLFQAYKDLNSIEQNIFGHGWGKEVSVLEKAVILLEDRYYTHRGIDVRSIIRELVKSLTFRKHGGASTIEMQFVRTCTGYKEISLRRKVYEMFLAWALLHRANKLEILRSYLGVAYFGTGFQGSDVASVAIFNPEPNQLAEGNGSNCLQCSCIRNQVKKTKSGNKKSKDAQLMDKSYLLKLAPAI